ncbi:MAG: hypothetical protein GF408_02835 [Candidatus Omnitrophica bacterium]|nr:hypothetical protein [Candidatus Omnitrophota bacterium]
METLKELNKICQKPDYRKKGNWMARYVVRDAALPLSWLLLHTPVTANQITFAGLAVALAACCCFSAAADTAFLAGALLLQFWYLLDHVDGHVARYRKQSSMTGIFFDYITHHIVHTGVYISLGLRAYKLYGGVLYLYAGIAAGLSILAFNLITDCKCKTFIWAVRWNGDALAYTGGDEGGPGKGRRSGTAPAGVLKKIFSFMHKTCEIHVVMNILTLAALAQFFFRGVELSRQLVWVYFFFSLIISVFKIGYIVVSRDIDREFVRYRRED